MIQTTPGIYLREKGIRDARQQQSGVATFVGIASKGPQHSLQRIESWNDFLDVFGNIIDYGYLPTSVYNFFQNGGEQCYVIRIMREPQPPDISVPEEMRDILAVAQTTTPVRDHNSDICLTLECINFGAWGNDLTGSITRDSKVEMDLTGLEQRVVDTDTVLQVTSAVDFFPGMTGTLVSSENPFVKREFQIQAINKLNRTLTTVFPVGESFPKGSRIFGSGFNLSLSYGSISEFFTNLSMNPRHPKFFEKLINGEGHYIDRRDGRQSILVKATSRQDVSGFAFFKPMDMGLSFRGGGDGFVRASATLSDSGFVPALRVYARERGRIGEGLRIEAAAMVTELSFDSGLSDLIFLENIKGLTVADVITLYDDAALVSETFTIQFIEPDTHQVTLDLATTHDFSEHSRVEIVNRFKLEVFYPDERTAVEKFLNLNMDSGDLLHFAETNINSVSDLIFVQAIGANPPEDIVNLENGLDPGEISSEYYIGFDASGNSLSSSLMGFGDKLGLSQDEDNLASDVLLLPDLIRSPIALLSERLEQWRTVIRYASHKSDRMVLIDPELEMELEEALFLTASLSKDSMARFGAFYFPQLKAISPFGEKLVPPSGAIAGMLRRMDLQAGAGRAPANTELKGLVALEKEVDSFDQAYLNPAGINCIRILKPGWIHILGARTLNPDPRYVYLHNRRVLNTLYKTLRRDLAWAVFEPNNSALQKKIKMAISSRLNYMARTGLTASGIPEEVFYVKCDGANNPRDLMDSGVVLAEIGLALSNPAEFIEIVLKRQPENIALTESDL